MTADTERSRSKLTEMAVRGSNYREDMEIELYGEPVEIKLRPLVDDEFLPIAAFLADHFDVDVDDEDFDTDEAVSEAIDEVDEAEAAEDSGVDVSQFDEEFVDIMQTAAVLGIAGSYDDEGNFVEHSTEHNKEVVGQLMGGYSLEIAQKVLEVSGDIRDADKFRGTRGSVDSTRDS